MEAQQAGRTTGAGEEDIEGLEIGDASWGDYPIDALLIRHESRTIHDVNRRIKQDSYVMDPEFQRDFIWDEGKQSKLIESVIMRIPLPVFYMAEDDEGRMVVVDGLQRLSTFSRFLADELKLRLQGRTELHGKRFSDLSAKLQNRIEDCNLILYVIDSKVPESARLDIFDRVNSGVPLTRQQMRNSLFMGQATRFLKDEANTPIFREATGGSLKTATMRDREFVNRFCAFQLLLPEDYRGDMDEFLAACLKKMNTLEEAELSRLSRQFRRGLANNHMLFGRQAFRKYRTERRAPLNASFWDVMSTGLSRYGKERIETHATPLRQAVYELFEDEEFDTAITYGPNDPVKVRTRFRMAWRTIKEILGAHPD